MGILISSDGAEYTMRKWQIKGSKEHSALLFEISLE